MPFGINGSFVHPNIDLLTVEQALADFATLIVHIKEEMNASQSPVIAFGGRYVFNAMSAQVENISWEVRNDKGPSVH